VILEDSPTEQRPRCPFYFGTEISKLFHHRRVDSERCSQGERRRDAYKRSNIVDPLPSVEPCSTRFHVCDGWDKLHK